MPAVNTMSADHLIRAYQLAPHPEGGYFRESYRSDERIPHAVLPARYSGPRRYSTAIYFLLPKGAKSHLHRIASDEIWHFYAGGPLIVVEIQANGSVQQVVLGADLEQRQRVQHVVKAGTWFGAYPAPGSEFSFVGCTVAPGFEFADFELGERQRLIEEFPHARNIIERLTRE